MVSSAHRKIPFSRPVLAGAETQAVAVALEAGAFAGRGQYTSQTEGRLSAMQGNSPVLLTNSGSTALLAALLAFRLRPGDKVIIPSFSFVAVAQAVVLAGGVPVFVDVDSRTGSMSPDSLHDCRARGVRGLIVIHYGGFAADMDRIQEIASARGWFVVEDAAHGFDGSHTQGRLGTLGEVGVLSFDHQKNIQCGEGGALVVNDPKNLGRLLSIINLGTNVHAPGSKKPFSYDWVSPGVKGYPPDYVAAILSAQLDALSSIQRHRHEQVEFYMGRLVSWAGEFSIRLPLQEPFALQPSWHIFWLTFHDSDAADSFIAWMQRAGVECKKHYSSLALLTRGREFESGPTTGSDYLAGCLVRLPLGLHLTHEDVDYVVATALAWEGRAS